MIALACGIHEARRRIACPICPRVLAELREEGIGVFQAFAPIGKGKLSTQHGHKRGRPTTGHSAKLYAVSGRRKRLPEAVRDEIAKRVRRGESTSAVCAALGVTTRTVRKWSNRS